MRSPLRVSGPRGPSPTNGVPQRVLPPHLGAAPEAWRGRQGAVGLPVRDGRNRRQEGERRRVKTAQGVWSNSGSCRELVAALVLPLPLSFDVGVERGPPARAAFL